MIVYKCQSPNGRIYIGQTTQSLAARQAEHKSRNTNTPFANAVKKYGAAMEWSIIDRAKTQAELDKKESEWIAKLNTLAPRGYNLRAGGNGGRHSEATIAKMRAAHAGRKGIKPNAATRRKLSAVQIGGKKSAATRRKIAESMKGNQNAAR